MQARKPIVVKSGQLLVALPASELAASLGITASANATDVPITIAASLTRTGKVVRLVQHDGYAASPGEAHPHLLKLLHRAQNWWAEMIGSGANVTRMAKIHEVTPSYVTWAIRLNFLAPGIVQQIISGTAPTRIDARMLLGLSDLPLEWSAQEKLLLAG